MYIVCGRNKAAGSQSRRPASKLAHCQHGRRSASVRIARHIATRFCTVCIKLQINRHGHNICEIAATVLVVRIRFLIALN